MAVCAAAGGRAADEQRHLEALALHLPRDVHHLVERGRDEADSPMTSAPISRALSRIFSHGTITPRSMTS
jgi:hypothetical protein